MPTRQHFLFYPKRWLEKSRLLLPVNVYLAFRFFPSRVNWKFSSSFTTRYVDRVFICLKSGLKIQLYRFFSLRYADRLLFPQSGWKDPALHNFSCYSKRRQCLLFLRFYTSCHEVRALSLVFTLCALCLCVCVCQTLYLREFSYCFAGWHSNKKYCMPNSKTGGGDWKKSRLLLPVNVYLAFRFFSSRVNWKFSSSFTTRYVDRVFICLKSGLKIQLYRFFPLRYADRLLFPQSGWKDPALRNFSCYSKRRQCLLFFCDSTRLVMRSVPCLWFSHFVPCAFVCVCVKPCT